MHDELRGTCSFDECCVDVENVGPDCRHVSDIVITSQIILVVTAVSQPTSSSHWNSRGLDLADGNDIGIITACHCHSVAGVSKEKTEEGCLSLPSSHSQCCRMLHSKIGNLIKKDEKSRKKQENDCLVVIW